MNEVVNTTPFSATVIRWTVLVLGAAVLLGCATLSREERAAKRAELDDMANNAIATLLSVQPEVREVFERSVGYMVIDMKVTKIPLFGAGGGLGMVVDKRTESRSYIKVSRFEMGGGLGAQRFRVIVIFDDRKLVDRVASGAWHYDAGVEAAAGSATAGPAAGGTDKGYHAFRIADGGAAATVTVRVARSKPFLE